MFQKKRRKEGMTLIDVLIGIAILLTVFVGVSGVLRVSFEMAAISKSNSSALALANQQLEFIRSLPYADVGTVSGIPSGTIPQNATTTLNGVEYNTRTFIQYVDDAADGTDAGDTNSITADYKRAKVEVTWMVKGSARSYFLVSNIVPVGIETLASGGTLTVNVFDALGAPVVNADVRIVNNTTTPTIDVTSFSNAAGVVTYPGAPQSSEYAVRVPKAGSSTARTSDATAALPNPNPAHLTVLDGDTTTTSFSIDLLSSKTIRTLSPVATSTFVDPFNTAAYVAANDPTIEVSGSELRLVDEGPTDYSTATATATMTPVTDLLLYSWLEMRWTSNEPVSTDARIRFHHDDGGTIRRIPNVDLPGNDNGFVSSPIDLSSLATSTYNELIVEMILQTDDASTTPSIQDWTIEFNEGPTPLPNIDFNLLGTKTIGTDGGAAPVYKVNEDGTTDINGEYATTTLEWDTYNLTVDDGATGYDVAEACEPQPLAISPNTNVLTKLLLVPDTSHTLLVSVRDDTNALLSGADVRVHRGGGPDITIQTSGCGQAFFENMPQGTVGGGNAYNVDVTHPSFTADTQIDIEIDDISNHNVVLFP